MPNGDNQTIKILLCRDSPFVIRTPRKVYVISMKAEDELLHVHHNDFVGDGAHYNRNSACLSSWNAFSRPSIAA
jgi:hypothetical protein